MLRGRILAESLRPGVVLEVPDLRIARVWREDVSVATVPTQPPVWTFLDVEAPDERADALSDALAAALLPDNGWWADFTVGDDRVIVFAGRVFRYRKGGRGRACGGRGTRPSGRYSRAPARLGRLTRFPAGPARWVVRPGLHSSALPASHERPP